MATTPNQNYKKDTPYVLLSGDEVTLGMVPLSDVMSSSKYRESIVEEVISSDNCIAYAVDYSGITDHSTWEYGVEKEFKFYGILKAIQLDGSTDINIGDETNTNYKYINKGGSRNYSVGCIFFALGQSSTHKVLFNRLTTHYNQRITVSPDTTNTQKSNHSIRIVCKKIDAQVGSTSPAIMIVSAEVNIPYYTKSPKNEGYLTYKYHSSDSIGSSDYGQVATLPILQPNYFEGFDKVSIGVNLEGFTGNSASADYSCNDLLAVLQANSANNKFKMQLEINTIKKAT